MGTMSNKKFTLRIEGTIRQEESMTWIFDHNTINEENKGYWDLDDIYNALYLYEYPDEIVIILRRETDPPADKEF